MTAISFPDVFRENIEVLQRATSRRAPEGVSLEQAEGTALLAKSLGEAIRALWRKRLARLTGGLEAGEARAVTAATAQHLESWLGMHRRLQEWGAAFAAKGTPLEGLAELGALAEELQEANASARKILDLVNAPGRPIDPRVLAQGQSDYDPGNYRSTRDVIDRRKAKQPK